MYADDFVTHIYMIKYFMTDKLLTIITTSTMEFVSCYWWLNTDQVDMCQYYLCSLNYYLQLKSINVPEVMVFREDLWKTDVQNWTLKLCLNQKSREQK
jgi:hypothetical protein